MRTTEEHFNFVRENLQTIEADYMRPQNPSDESLLLFQRLWKLAPDERKLMILYAELSSCRMVGMLLNISRQTVMNRLDRIKQKLL